MLDEASLQRSALKAYQLIHAFVEKHHCQPWRLAQCPHSADSRGRLHKDVRAFGNFVVIYEHANDWGKRGYISKAMAETLPLFQDMALSDFSKTSLDGYASWLYRGKGQKQGYYASVTDQAVLESAANCSAPHLALLRLRLFYHELGHFALHRDKLLGTATSQSGYAKVLDAQKEMELEAWIFSATILGIAMADRAFMSKTSKSVDDAWRMPAFSEA